MKSKWPLWVLGYTIVVAGIPSTGAADDLVKATALARAGVTRYGMNPRLGPIAYEQDVHPLLHVSTSLAGEGCYREETAREIDIQLARVDRLAGGARCSAFAHAAAAAPEQS